MTAQITTISPGAYYQSEGPKLKLKTALPGFCRLIRLAWNDLGENVGAFTFFTFITVVICLLVFLAYLGWQNKIPAGILLFVISIVTAALILILTWSAEIILAMRIASGREKISLIRIFRLGKANAAFIFSSTAFSGLLIILSYLFFIIPGFIASALCQFAVFAAPAEDLNWIKALRRSRAISKKYVWENLILSALFFIIGIILAIACALILLIYYHLSTFISQILSGIIVAAFIWALMILTCPLLLIALTRRYFHLAKLEENNESITSASSIIKLKAIILITVVISLLASVYYFGFLEDNKEIKKRPAIIEPIKTEELENLDEIDQANNAPQEESPIPQEELDEIPVD